MADEATTTPVATPDEAQATTENKGTATPPAEAKNTETPAEPMIPKSRLDEVLTKLKAYEQEKTKAQKDAEAAETARLAEQGKYKEIADTLQAKLDAAQAEARTAAIKLLQRDAAAQVKLPAVLADRLKGDTLEEMITDAKAILESLPKPSAPDINASNGAGGAPAPGQMSDVEKQQLAAVLGVNPRFM